ncbi:MAG: hypothetical protein BGO01_12950 [Armatimonadetes bacterium 55-13]|mgnify:CR=1 FL=1|nr:DUF503 domain-containing protein [Armatimonadota bacterium]OJU61817.1 MAG: hypothetical protein BGO01_12950 [Armatimonadetes bacterium 55-13]
MVVGIMEISLKMEGTESLKDKRRILRSLLERARHDYHVAIAEVDDQDLWGNATLGVSCVSNDAAHVESIMNHVLALIDENVEVEVDNVCREVERR